MCDRFDQVKQGYHEPNDTPLYVEEDFVMHGVVKDGVSNHTVHTTVAVLPQRKMMMSMKRDRHSRLSPVSM